jgi:cytochrome c553
MNAIRNAALLVLLIAGAAETAAAGLAVDAPAPSIRRGEVLVTTGGGGRTVRCALCHGDDLRGLGSAPAIAGRSPGYLVRRLSDMQKGVRRGLRSDLMSPSVARLTERDMIAIAAYVASRQP